MRKIAYIVILIMMSLLFPGMIYADSYTVNDDELTISFEDPSWVVFTRDNLKDNEQLKKLGTDEKTMLATMEKSYAYVVAIKGGAKKRGTRSWAGSTAWGGGSGCWPPLARPWQ